MKIKFTNKWRALWRAGFFYTLLFVSTVKFDLMILKNFNTLQTVVSPTSLQHLSLPNPTTTVSPTSLQRCWSRVMVEGKLHWWPLRKASLIPAMIRLVNFRLNLPFSPLHLVTCMWLQRATICARYPLVGMLLSFFFFSLLTGHKKYSFRNKFELHRRCGFVAFLCPGSLGPRWVMTPPVFFPNHASFAWPLRYTDL